MALIIPPIVIGLLLLSIYIIVYYLELPVMQASVAPFAIFVFGLIFLFTLIGPILELIGKLKRREQ